MYFTVFEKIIHIWLDMVDLQLIPEITRDNVMRNLYNNPELQKIEHDLKERKHSYMQRRREAVASQARVSMWLRQLYSAFTPGTRNMLEEVYRYLSSFLLLLN